MKYSFVIAGNIWPRLLCSFAMTFLFLTPAYADVSQPDTKATLVSEFDGFVPGKPFALGVLLESKKGWHTYWENPGDAGMATTFAWTLPENFKAGDIEWPAPEHLMEGELATFSFVDKVFLPVTITPPEGVKDDVTFKVKAQWLACSDICVPESANLQITLPTTSNPAPTAAAPLFKTARDARPTPIPTAGNFAFDGQRILLNLPISEIKIDAIQSVYFFPREQNIIRYAETPSFAVSKNKLAITLTAGDSKPGETISGILMLHGKQNHYYDVRFTRASAATAPESTTFLPYVLLLAIFGGLILNLMPCVLPVLSLKALAIAKKSGHEHRDVVRQGVAYTFGILLSFALIAGTLIFLRDGGEAIGWGYQMQSPAFVGFLIYLLFLVGLNLSGYFDLPVLLGNVGGEIASESSVRGSFFTGVLATAVATPCTAPFMASAVGVALTLAPWQGLLIFEALGFGLALPFLLISIFPSLRRFLPKPGAWMDSFKQLLAFPMYASVIWLLWVLTLQTGASGMVLALTGLLLITVIIWLKSVFADGSPAYRWIALILYASLLAYSLPMLGNIKPATSAMPAHDMSGIPVVDYSPKKLEELRAAGKPVLIDATAAWCITCQINARTAIHTTRAMDALRKEGVMLMIADWTLRNDDITAFLDGFGFKGVPLVVFYPAGGGKPRVLPQILTEDMVIDAITK